MKKNYLVFVFLVLVFSSSVFAQVPEKAFVVDNGLRAIFEVDSASGDRIIISGDSVGLGPSLISPTRLLVNPSNKLFVIDTGLNAVLEVDILTGNRNIVFQNSLGVLNEGAFDGNGSLYLTHSFENAVSKIDINAGSYQVISDSIIGIGEPFDTIEGIAAGNDGYLYVADSRLGISEFGDGIIYKVNIATGDREVFDYGPGGSPFYSTPRGLALDTAANDLIIIDTTGIIPINIIRLDIETKSRSFISNKNDNGPATDYYSQIALSSNGDLIAVGPTLDFVVQVNGNTGDRTVVSSNQLGQGPSYVGDILGVVLMKSDSDGDGILDVSDNCDNDANPLQEDHDQDSVGNVCDTDDDNDGVIDSQDNCQFAANPSQQDEDSDGKGLACDNGLEAKDFIRVTSEPIKETIMFESSLPVGTLKIFNGGMEDSQSEVVSSSEIYLNGQLLVGPSNFNQNVNYLEKSVQLQNLNFLEIALKGKPGGKITLKVE